jgi:hypothetical protein
MAFLILHELRDHFGTVLLLHGSIKPSVGDTSLPKRDFTHCFWLLVTRIAIELPQLTIQTGVEQRKNNSFFDTSRSWVIGIISFGRLDFCF